LPSIEKGMFPRNACYTVISSCQLSNQSSPISSRLRLPDT